MVQYYRKSKVQAVVLIRQEHDRRGKPVVTDVVVMKESTKDLAASSDVSQHPLVKLLLIRASELGGLYPVENFQALHGKGVTGIINGKQVL